MSKLELINKQALLEKLPYICRYNHGCEPPFQFDDECEGCEVYELHEMVVDMEPIKVELPKVTAATSIAQLMGMRDCMNGEWKEGE